MMEIIPYVYLKDHWSISYDVIETIWEKMLQDGTFKRVFAAGTVKTFEQFYAFLQNKNNCVVTIWDGNDIAFIGWLNNFTATSAAAHFSCFKSSFGKAVEISKVALKYWFGFPFLKTIIGTIPEDNRLAISAVKRSGGTVIGTIPAYSKNIYKNKIVGATIIFFERGEK